MKWGRLHFLRHWFGLGYVMWFTCRRDGQEWLVGKCYECEKIVDQF